MQYIIILGRQPAIGTAELESVFGSSSVMPLTPGIVQVETNTEINSFDHFGSIQKVAAKLEIIDGLHWEKITRKIKQLLQTIENDTPEGKLTLGISCYNLNINPRQLNATALEFKKALRQTGRSVRIVPNDEPTLNAAKIKHNKLTGSNGVELLVIRHGSSVTIARTHWAQDIDAYAARDRERPMRDSRVGMLPPKLAQTIINLAVNDIEPRRETIVLDPFCGTGVLVQEAALMGFGVRGSDLEPRMVDYSAKNLAWLADKYPHLKTDTTKSFYDLKQADATNETWDTFDFIAAETFLGRPLTSLPDAQTLKQIISDCNIIHKKFLKNVAHQTKPGFRMCIAVPAWRTKNGFMHLPILDHLSELGYNRVSFVHAKTSDLIYHREDQVVARELVVLIRE